MGWVSDRLRGLGFSGGGTFSFGAPGGSATIRLGEPTYRWDLLVLVVLALFLLMRR